MKKKLTIQNFLTAAEIVTINQAIAEAEKTTSGEIKILVVNRSSRMNLSTKKAKRFFVWRRAKKEFIELGLHDTDDHTGILLMISLKEQIVVVKGDSSIDGKIKQLTWDMICDDVATGIAGDKAAAGIISAVERIGSILTEHFPIKPGDVNEIADEIIFKE